MSNHHAVDDVSHIGLVRSLNLKINVKISCPHAHTVFPSCTFAVGTTVLDSVGN